MCPEILSATALKSLTALQQKKYRNREGKLIIEGFIPVLEAIRSAWVISDIYFTPYIQAKPGFDEILNSTVPLHEIDAKTLKKISTETTPQGVIAVAAIPEFSSSALNGNLLYLDRIQDPGNLGTLFRIADWFGLGGIVLSPDCVDISNPKTVRSAKGSLFHLPWIELNSPADLMQLFPSHHCLITKVHDGISISDIHLSRDSHFILVIGNESHGVDPEFQPGASTDITMPPLGGAESLNAAMACAAILGKLLY